MSSYAIFAFLSAWLVILSYQLYKIKRHYSNLTERTKKQKIDEILDFLISDQQKLKDEAEKIKIELGQVIDKSRFYFQKIGIVRFNPFGRTGTDQSFVLALLDKEDNGIVANFIYTHDGLRIYTKRVKGAKGEEFKLTDEELEAIKTSK